MNIKEYKKKIEKEHPILKWRLRLFNRLWLIQDTIISFVWLNILRKKPVWRDAEKCERLCCKQCGKGKLFKN